ncbi:Uncharacterised protein [uncultured archaeon]|nr:Uncharacterised protein [uncultured archaeon]
MIETIFFFLIILGVICVALPPIGTIIIQVLSMPVRVAFADVRIAGSVAAVLIILIALGIVRF